MSKTLLCSTDAGGFSNLLPIGQYLESNNQDFLFLTGKKFHERLEKIESVNVMFIDDASDAGKLRQILVDYNPGKFICGTTSYLSPERILTLIAKENKIKTIAVLDEWYNYKMRFADTNNNLIYEPDHISVMDELAYSEAAEEGLPGKKLSICGSPALTEFYNNITSASFKPSIPDYLRDHKDSVVITFISEEIKADNKKNEKDRVFNNLGYDEEKVLNDILKAVKFPEKKTVVVEKLHPSSERSEESEIMDNGVILLRVKRADLISLFQFSDLVIGMKSIALLQSAIMGKKTLSYQPDLKTKNLCTAVKLNLIPFTSSIIGLKEWIVRSLRKESDNSILAKAGFIDDESVTKILAL